MTTPEQEKIRSAFEKKLKRRHEMGLQAYTSENIKDMWELYIAGRASVLDALVPAIWVDEAGKVFGSGDGRETLYRLPPDIEKEIQG